MIIKKKLFRTNTIMIAIPLATLIILNSIYVEILQGNLPIFQNIITANENSARNLYFIYEILEYLVVLIAFAVSYFFTKRSIDKIMIPIENLCDGAKRMQEGNFSEDVPCDNADDLEKVCAAFNEMQHELTANIQKNKKYEQDRNEMLAGISHDLRTPLTSIKSYVKGLLDGVTKDPEKEREYLKVVYRKSSEMEGLIDQLFIFSKLETGNLPFYFTQMSIEKYIVTFLDLFEYDSKHVTITLNNDCPIQEVMIDGEQMDRVLNNILENSIKYNRDRELHVKVFLYQSGDNAVIRIRDDGIGVSEEKLPRLFDSFYRGSEARSNPTDGSGLGLAIAKKIVTAHGGNITAESSGGLTVTIQLPIAAGTEV